MLLVAILAWGNSLRYSLVMWLSHTAMPDIGKLLTPLLGLELLLYRP